MTSSSGLQGRTSRKLPGLLDCKTVHLCVSLAYLWHPFQSPLWNAEMVLCTGQWEHQLAETGCGGKDEMDGMPGWVSQREEEKRKPRNPRGKKIKESLEASKAGVGVGGWCSIPGSPSALA